MDQLTLHRRQRETGRCRPAAGADTAAATVIKTFYLKIKTIEYNESADCVTSRKTASVAPSRSRTTTVPLTTFECSRKWSSFREPRSSCSGVCVLFLRVGVLEELTHLTLTAQRAIFCCRGCRSRCVPTHKQLPPFDLGRSKRSARLVPSSFNQQMINSSALKKEHVNGRGYEGQISSAHSHSAVLRPLPSRVS